MVDAVLHIASSSSKKRHTMVVSLVDVLEQAPALLQACLCDDEIPALRRLRLVSRNASAVALLGLTSYTLTVKGRKGDTNISGARLLQASRLKSLNMHLCLSGMYSPNLMLEMFIREAGASLQTITSLDLRLQDTCGSTLAAAALNQQLVVLANTITALEFLCVQGHLSAEILQSLGQKSKDLTDVTFIVGSLDLAYLQSVMLLQPTLLPHITRLTLKQLDYTHYDIPYMAGNTSIRYLDLQGFTFDTDAQWMCLPHGLQHLGCYGINHGPPPRSDGTKLLGSLESFGLLMECPVYKWSISLHPLALVLRSAPALDTLQMGCGELKLLTIDCVLDESTHDSVAADLFEIWRNMHFGLISMATVRIDSSQRETGVTASDVIGTMPCMMGFTQLECMDLVPGELGSLLHIFPDIEYLLVDHASEMELENSELLKIAACASLTSLDLNRCNNISAVGLLLLCQSLPCLCEFSCSRCSQLTESVLQECEELLTGFGRLVEMKHYQYPD